ncbi:MAG: GHMP family kinase ATP-binding protein [Promethearchaeota archaeon]|jgi:galactokinase/mevalonate kinase-like predicted kinase
MLKDVKDFLFSLNPDIVVQAPSRINLINPLDAVEGDFWMPSVAINGKINPLSVFLYIKKTDQLSSLKIYSFDNDTTFRLISEEHIQKNVNFIKRKMSGDKKLIYGSIYRLMIVSASFVERFKNSNFEIGILTTIPPKSGLGGSTAIIIAVIFGLTQFFKLYNNLNELQGNELPFNKDTIAEIAMRVEDKDLEITAGYSDRYIISRGGLRFCSYVGKIDHREIDKEPLAICDRIDDIYDIHDMPLLVCFSGKKHESGDIHRTLRKLYLQKDKKVLNCYKKLAELSWKSRFALMRHDWELLGDYFKENTKLMNNIMKYAGYKHGIGLVNNILINIFEEHRDVYAAKLTGAGGGGSIFALVNPNNVDLIYNYLKDDIHYLSENSQAFSTKFPSYSKKIAKDLKNTRIFQVTIDKIGVKKL